MIRWAADATSIRSWPWPVDFESYDRTPALTRSETSVLASLPPLRRGGGRTAGVVVAGLAGADRIVRPLLDASRAVDAELRWRDHAVLELLRACAREGVAFWGWDAATWRRELAPVPRRLAPQHSTWCQMSRHPRIGIGYLLGCLPDLSVAGLVEWTPLAQRVFGRAGVNESLDQLAPVVASWGYSASRHAALRHFTSRLMFYRGSPHLDALTAEFLASVRDIPALRPRGPGLVRLLSRVLVELEVIPSALPSAVVPTAPDRDHVAGVAPEWLAVVRGWEQTSVLAPRTRATYRHWLLKVGRWLAVTHPYSSEPSRWTREVAATAVAAIDRMNVGDYTTDGACLPIARRGQPLSPASKSHAIRALRTFFVDLQEWGWIPRIFNPARALAVPRSIQALIGPAPRTIADDIWAKLLWAGLNLGPGEAPRHGRGPRGSQGSAHLRGGSYYPTAMLRALATVWLFGGLRSDEIVRLRVGCVRWQDPTNGDQPAARVCLLDVPVHKTGHAFTKPVDPVVGEAIAGWEAIRPNQPRVPDRKTGQLTAFLFSYRGRHLSVAYLNRCLIPLLCRKAGVPLSDARGSITSHRARSTIASQLYNAKEPMTLFELQAWLGHRSPATTQHYTQITPNTLAKAYSDAGYFARNVRAIEVLVDRDAVQSGAAARGEPWQYFDLGHGYCTYSFFEQCQHRMACARCDFYVPKNSTRSQLLEAKSNLQRMALQIPLTEEERTAVEDGTAALDALLERLADVPTPAGPTPRQLGLEPLPMLPAPPGEE